MDLMQVMKSLSDETRIRILNLLKHGDLCVCELEILLNINQSNASRHLNKLTGARILEYYKVAQYVYYRLVPDTMREFPFIEEIINNHTSGIRQCAADFEKLKKYRESGLTCEDLKAGRLCTDIK